MRKPVLLAIFMLIPASFVHSQVLPIEREALVALYNSTGGASWTNKTNWLGAVGTECDWYGITCNLSWGQVTSISLGNNNLIGTIPPELGDFSNLFYLFLNGNQLTGSIPPELGNLSNLLNLYLHGNQLTGSIPPELGNTNLGYTLNLSNNHLTGSIPADLGKLVGLDQIYLQNNQLNGSIPPDLGDISGLKWLDLSNNQLSGSIPPELGQLAYLERLLLQNNQLDGSIPPELGNLSSLLYMHLNTNQLTGSIPAELQSLSSLQWLYLHSNRLTGSIPAELGNLPSVYILTLNGNMLTGEIPVEFGNLGLIDVNGLDLQWNALHSDNPTLIAYLDSKHFYGVDWQSNQTVAPENLTVDSAGDHTVWLSWDAVTYQTDPGGYEVFSSPAGSGVWTSGGWAEAKTTNAFPVTGLNPSTSYDFSVLTYTEPHADNLNLVNSEFSAEVMTTTTGSGCTQPAIQKTGAGPFTLSLTESYDSYSWSTGEATSTIDVNPPFEQWYWVTVTSAGPCEETATTSVAPYTPLIFADGFETGDTDEWSSALP